MSSLWTPGGEVPVDRERTDRPADERPGEGTDRPPEDDEIRAQYAEMQRQVLEAPAADVVVQHVASLYELAALHLSQERPRLGDIRLLIDALSALVEGLQGRLGEPEAQLAAALPQLKMAFVEATDRARGAGSGGESTAGVE